MTRYIPYRYRGNREPLFGPCWRGLKLWDQQTGFRAFQDDLIPDDFGVMVDYHGTGFDFNHRLDGGGRINGTVSS